ncbi:MAG: hypothetical protein LBV51_05790 [Acholeplasmatales bacterium]|jgi:hypothetical protein|nr:hypothetical protein [Acholeplasmatales bacterium]
MAQKFEVTSDIINLNLTELATSTIEEDINTFFADGKATYNGIINTIVANYLKYSDRVNIKLEFSYLDLKDANSYSKRRINVDTQNMIEYANTLKVNDESVALRCGYNVAKLMKLIIESYVRSLYINRQELLFMDKFIAIERADTLSILTIEKALLTLHKVGVFPAKESTFHYFVGIDQKNDSHSIKIMNMLEVSVPKKGIKVTKEIKEKEEQIIKEIYRNGPQFITFPSHDIKVRFTKQGISDYYMRLINRPFLKSKDGDIYTFYCSRKQAFVYFSRFTYNVEILEPSKSRKEFKENFQKALALYENTEAEETSNK